jgi:hypothetical protein
MKNILFLIVTIVLFSCENKTETIKGELYFKLVRLLPSDGSSESAIETYLKKIEKSNNASDKKAYDYFSSLKKHNLLSAPKIMIKLESGEVKEVFLNQEQYQKVKNYKLMDLNSRGKKVILLMEVEKLENDILFSNNIENIKVVNGKNSWSK